jgi:hypothetical protein
MAEAQVCSSQPTSAWPAFRFQSPVTSYSVGQMVQSYESPTNLKSLEDRVEVHLQDQNRNRVRQRSSVSAANGGESDFKARI